MSDLSDLRYTIVPKSDQLNAEQLLGGPITVTVSDVRLGGGDDQPIAIHYENDDGRPYKPCKTMRKVLIFAWGENGATWAGKSMTLYNDPSVRFGGMAVGGIRISHLSDIERDITLSLTATKGKKAAHTIKLLASNGRKPDHAARIASAETVDELKAAFKAAYRSTQDAAQQQRFKTAYDARMAALGHAPKSAYDPVAALNAIHACNDRAQLAELVDRLRTEAPDDDARAKLGDAFALRDADLADA